MISQQKTNLNELKSLKQFQCPFKEIFIDATSLPEFFKANLVDDARVVKYFHKDPQANIRIFYYQYLKLCFEINNIDYEGYIEKIYELLRSKGFEFYFQKQQKQKALKNEQYKSILVDFFEVMKSSSADIDEVLSHYPILDEVFTRFFRTVIIIASVTDSYTSYVNKNEMFDFLSSFFCVEISSYDKCLKFVESDIFVYEEDQQNIYMAYIRDCEEVQNQRNQIRDFNKEGSKSNQEQKDYKGGEQMKKIDCKSSEKTTIKLIQKHTLIQKESCSTDGTKLLSQNEQDKLIRILSKQQNANKLQINRNSKELIYKLQQEVNNLSKQRPKKIVQESYIAAQFADYTSFNEIQASTRNISSFQENYMEKARIENNEQDSLKTNLQNKSSSRKSYSSNQKDQKPPETKQNKFDQLHSQQKTIENQNYIKDPNVQALNTQKSKMNLSSKNQKLQDYANKSKQIKISNNNKEPIEAVQVNSQDFKNSKTLNKNLLEQKYESPTKDSGFSKHEQLETKFVQSVTQLGQIDFLTEKKQFINDKKTQGKNQTQTVNYEEQNIKSRKSQTKIDSFQKSLFYRREELTLRLMPANLSFPKREQKLNLKKQNEAFATEHSTRLIKIGTEMFDVTKEFSNTRIMKLMPEPHKSNVYEIRQRARRFRKNIYQQGGLNQFYNVEGIDREVKNEKRNYFQQEVDERNKQIKTPQKQMFETDQRIHKVNDVQDMKAKSKPAENSSKEQSYIQKLKKYLQSLKESL